MKMFQINESDLETLEAALPELYQASNIHDESLHEYIEMCKKILSNVRWNYGPHTEIEEIDL